MLGINSQQNYDKLQRKIVGYIGWMNRRGVHVKQYDYEIWLKFDVFIMTTEYRWNNMFFTFTRSYYVFPSSL